MPSYKLTYFQGRGRAEVTRILFEVAGVKYEDVRIKQEDWPALKPKTPFGSLPVLEVDGVQIAQSKAVARYLARELGLYGANSKEQLNADIVCELCDDLASPMMGFFFEKDEEKKKELAKKYYDETAPRLLGYLQKVLCHNKEGSGFFVGDKISLADIVFLTIIDWVANPEHPDVLDAFPKLKAATQRIRSQDKIADWLKRRPESPF